MILNINFIYVSPGYYCTEVIDTSVRSLDSIEILWVHLKKNIGKISPTNKHKLRSFIKEEWEYEAYSIHEKAFAGGN